jgi:phosphatidylserine/phosphatidylglycerophosphate/cardiolipin synthase-like enzyme
MQAYFDDDIQPLLLEHIVKAQKSIVAAIAYFTDNAIFEALLLAQKRGVQVALIIANDPINHQSLLNYGLLAQEGCALYWYPPATLMHHKFCIIDNALLLMGSYNWTKAAAYYNRESLICFSEAEIVEEFCREFEKLLCDAQPDAATYNFYQNTAAKENLLAQLRAKIAATQAEIASLTEEKNSLELQIQQLELNAAAQTHELMLRLKEIQMKIAEKKATLTRKKQDLQHAQEKQQEFFAYQQNYQQQHQQAPSPTLDSSDQELLRKLYREACMLAHPDRFADDPQKAKEAQQIMQELLAARQRNDLQTIQNILQKLKDQTAFLSDIDSIQNPDALHTILKRLLEQKEQLQLQIEQLKNTDSYRILLQYPDPNQYFELLKQQLQTQIKILEKELAMFYTQK